MESQDSLEPQKPSFYVTGGTLPPDSASYIERAADTELLAALQQGELCYVLNARQMGKSSLSVRTRQALEASGTRTAFLDLQKFGSSASAEQWYRAILERIGNDLKLRPQFLAFWRDNAELPPLTRVFNALRDVALANVPGKLVVFLDEIDVVRDLDFKTDEFFGAIRETHNARAEDPELKRLTFCILGTVAPTDLIRDIRLSPFNIGVRIKLADFTPSEAAPLAAPLPGTSKTLERVLWWTSGHPYLTQRLCAELTKTSSAEVDSAVARLFFSKSDADVDENIKNVRNGVLRMGGEGAGFDKVDLLTRYGKLASGKRVPDDDTDGVCTALRLSGLVTSTDGVLRVRNRVYAKLFDAAWIRDNLPDAEVRRQKAAVAKARWQIGSIAAAVMIAMSSLTTWALTNAKRADANAVKAAQREKDAIASAVAESKAKTEAQASAQAESRANILAQTAQQKAQKNAADALAALKREATAKTLAENALKGESLAKTVAQQSAIQALKNAQKAQQNAKTAKIEKRNAIFQTNIAKNNMNLSNRFLYISICNLAQRAINEYKYDLSTTYLYELAMLLKHNPGIKTGYEWLYLNEELHPEKIMLKTSGRVQSVSFSNDGTRAITGSTDSTAKIWDTSTGRNLITLGHGTYVDAVAFSPNGNQVVTCSSYSILLWNALNGNAINTFKKHSGRINTVAFSPDGKYILSGSDDNTAILWDIKIKKQVFTLTGHTNQIEYVAFSPDGKRCLTSGRDHTVRLWDVSSGKEILKLESFTKTSAAFSVDGKYILTGGFNGSTVWNAHTGDQIISFTDSSSIKIVAFSPDGTGIATVRNDNTIRLRDIATGKEGMVLGGHTSQINSIAFSPDGKQIITGSDDQTARIWDISPDASKENFISHERGEGFARWSADGKFSADGKSIITSSLYGSLFSWDLATGRKKIIYKNNSDTYKYMSTSKDCTKIVMANNDNAVWLWNANTASKILLKNEYNVNCVEFSPDGKYFITGSDDYVVRLWNASTGIRKISFRGHLSPVRSVAFSPDGKYILSGSDDKTARIWDISTGKEENIFRGHESDVNSVAFSPDGKSIITGSDDKTARIWNISSPNKVLILKGHSGQVTSVAYSPDGNRVITGSIDDSVKIWDTLTGREIITLKDRLPHHDGVTSVSFSPDGKQVLTGYGDGIVRVWRRLSDMQTKKLIELHTEEANQEELLFDAENIIKKNNLRNAFEYYNKIIAKFPQEDKWSSCLPKILINDISFYRTVTETEFLNINKATNKSQLVIPIRRAALIPDLLEDSTEYTPYVILGKRAADEVKKRALKPAEGDDMIFYSYGAILLRAGKINEAIVQLEKATKLKPDRIWPTQFLALAYAQRGDKATARQWFDKSEAWMATEMDKVFPGAENWAARLQVLLLWREGKQALGVK